MSNIPKEFDPSFIAEQSASEQHMYRAEVSSKEPMASVLKTKTFPDSSFSLPWAVDKTNQLHHANGTADFFQVSIKV